MNALANFLKVDVVWLQHGSVRQSTTTDPQSLTFVGQLRKDLFEWLEKLFLALMAL